MISDPSISTAAAPKSMIDLIGGKRLCEVCLREPCTNPRTKASNPDQGCDQWTNAAAPHAPRSHAPLAQPAQPAPTAEGVALIKPKNKLGLSIAGTWDGARQWLDRAALCEKVKVFCQVMLGFELLSLHKEHGIENGSKAHLSHDGKGGWEEILAKETGLSQSTSYRFMDMAKAAVPRLEKFPALKTFDPTGVSIASLPAPQQAALTKAVRKLTDGLTQKQFGETYGIWKKPAGSGSTGRAPGEGGSKKLSLSEQAAAMKLLAESDWSGLVKLLAAYKDKFTCLPDAAIEAQVASLEQALTARKAWLKQPVTARDPKAIAALFKVGTSRCDVA